MLELDKDVVEISSKYGKSKDHLLRILQDLVAKKGYLTEKIVRDLAKDMNISPNEVYSVATFYSFIKTKPTGKYVIRICQTISCDLAGKEEIIKALEKELRIKCGQTTDDMLFTLETTNCMGMCDQGPAMLVNDEVYTKMDSIKAIELIREYKTK
ncbi:MAG: hypothetical protein A2Y25_09260 [Candidatus Melainabacteria bacterium GWF2_37_15]|nr:MAG: hypothetical protein A2Y25_09260 [Candidatus Melainabacteria bacterium GWF2_37_15]